MANYSDTTGSVRVDRFKASGKWYDTFAVDMTKQYNTTGTPHDALIEALESVADPFYNKLAERVTANQDEAVMFLVCLEPYHKLEYPIILWLKES